MPQHDMDGNNPPESVLRPRVRTAALVTFVGGIVLVFLLVGAVLLFWRATDRPGTRGDAREDPAAVGTTGEPREGSSPGGFSADPKPGSPQDELEYRGVGEPRTGSGRELTSRDEKE